MIRAPWETADATLGSRLRQRSKRRAACCCDTPPPKSPTAGALTVNPAKTCQPIGAMYAALGIHRCLPHSHGSQGCCAYHRSTLTRHYKEPVMAATSSFTEGSSVFGGQANLLQAIQNIFAIYEPDVIAVHTTCLSETIGDDIPQIIAKARDEKKIPAGQVRHPRQHAQLRRLARDGLLQHGPGHGRLLRRAGRRPHGGDQPHPRLGRAGRHARDQAAGRHARAFPTIMFPDTSDVLDAPQTGRHVFYPQGGTTIDALRRTGGQPGHLRAGPDRLRGRRAAIADEVSSPRAGAGVAHRAAGDRPLHQRPAQAWPASRCPAEINAERGRLVDMMTDMHQYFYGKRVALWGDPDQLVSLAEFLADLDMRPVYVVTGTPGKRFENRIAAALAGRVPEAKIRQGAGADMFLMHQWIKQEPVDLLIGNTYGKYIARDENIPFVRHGFPDPRPRRALLLPHGRLPGRHAPPGNDPRCGAGPQGPQAARKKASSW